MAVSRERIQKIIQARCAFLNEEEQIDLERGIFNFSLEEGKHRHVHRVWENPEFQTLYDITAKRTILNLDSSSYLGNNRLAERLREGEFMPHDIAFMNYGELFPENWRALMEQLMKRETKLLEGNTEGATV